MNADRDIDAAELETLIEAWLNTNAQDNAKRYADEGRIYEAQPTKKLKERWIRLFKASAQKPGNTIEQKQREDVEGELTLRNERLPYDAVRSEVDAITSAMGKVVTKIKQNDQDDIVKEVLDDLKKFKADMKKGN